MPIYVHRCEPCGVTVEDVRPMRFSEQRPKCPGCRRRMPRDFSAELPSGHAFRAYEAQSGGVFQHLMRRAVREGDDYFVHKTRKRADGTTERYKAQLNAPGERLNPVTGNPVISTRRGKRDYMRRRSQMAGREMVDYGA